MKVEKYYEFNLKDIVYIYVIQGCMEITVKQDIDLVENKKYTFAYRGETRTVELIKEFPDYIHCRCRKPDKSAGGFRNFHKFDIENLVELDS